MRRLKCTKRGQTIFEVAFLFLCTFVLLKNFEQITYSVKSLILEATPLATQFFQRAYKISHPPRL